MNAEDFTKLLKCIDKGKLKNILQRMQARKFRVRGFNDLEKIPLSLVGGALSSQKKNSILFLNEVYLEYHIDELMKGKENDFEYLKSIMSSKNIPGVVSYLLIHDTEHETDILNMLEETAKDESASDKPVPQRESNKKEIDIKKEERFRQKYLEQISSNKSLQEKLSESQNQLNTLQNDVLLKNARISELIQQLSDLEKQCLHQKDINSKLKAKLLKTSEELQTTQNEIEKKKVLALCSEEINLIEGNNYKITFYEGINIDEVKALSTEFSELWVINSEIVSPSFTRKISKDSFLANKVKKFNTPADLEKYIKMR